VGGVKKKGEAFPGGSRESPKKGWGDHGARSRKVPDVTLGEGSVEGKRNRLHRP